MIANALTRLFGDDPLAPPPRPLLQKFSHALADELEPLFSLKLLADLAALLPGSALCRTRTAMFRAAGVSIGPRSLIQGSVHLTGSGNPATLLSIGSDTLITGTLHADLGAPVHIGNWVRIGHGVTLLTVNHEVGPSRFRAGPRFFGEIVIEDGCWLASRVTILPRVTLNAGCIVAAGAVVTHSVPANTLVAGVPARVVRELDDDGNPGRSPDSVARFTSVGAEPVPDSRARERLVKAE